MTTASLGGRATVRIPRAQTVDLSAALDSVTELHERLGVPVTTRADHVATWSRLTRTPVTAVIVPGPDGLRAAALLTVRRRGPLLDVRLALDGIADEQRLPACDQGAAEELAGQVVRLLDHAPLWRLDLEQLQPGNPVLAHLETVLASRGPVAVGAGDVLPEVRWSGGRPSEGWSRKKTRQKVRQAARRLDESGRPWNLERLLDPDAVRAALPATLALREEREVALGRADDLADPRRRELHTALVERHLERGAVELWQLTVSGELVMYAIAVADGENGEVRRLVDSRMRPGAEELSAGILLFGRMLQAWYADGRVEVVDLGRGLNDFKRQIHTGDRPTAHLRAWSHPALARAEDVTRAGAETLRMRLRHVRDSSSAAAATVRTMRRLQNRRRGTPVT